MRKRFHAASMELTSMERESRARTLQALYETTEARRASERRPRVRTSVSDDPSATHRRMNELSDEVRARVTTAETAILHAVRDLGRDLDRRLVQVGQRMADTGARLKRIEDAQQG
ncbi:hypothetical protein BH23ACT8_BH23ACT8_01810 [soil metagenome]